MTEQKRKVGRPATGRKKKGTNVALSDELTKAVREYLPVYSRKMLMQISLSRITEKALWEFLKREKENEDH